MSDWDLAGRARSRQRLELLVDDDAPEAGTRGRRPDVCAACAAERARELALLEWIQAALRSVRIPLALRAGILAAVGSQAMDDSQRGN